MNAKYDDGNINAMVWGINAKNRKPEVGSTSVF
jgi:hypothetical protein